MEKITITRALKKLKDLDKRITKTTRNAHFANYTVGGKPYIENYTPDENLQSIKDLINNRSALKTGIMQSNAVTKVKIGNKTMTVVEAIEMKSTIEYQKTLLKKISSDVGTIANRVEDINDDVRYRLDKMLEANFSKDSKTKEEDYKAISVPFLKRNEAKTVDSQKYTDIAIALDEEIDEFESEVDLVLSESNAVTKIEV